MAGQLPPGFQIDPALSEKYGKPVAFNPTTGQKMGWREGGGPTAPPGSTPRPEYGPGVYETPDGSILKQGKTGTIQSIRGAQTAGADSRPRLQLGLGPTVEAQKNLFAEEQWNRDMSSPEGRLGSNPHDSFGGSIGNLLNDMNPDGKSVLKRAAKVLGGDRYQRYTQAAKTFESAFMPILSGAAVTPSEAQRLLGASLPEAGDSPEILARKSKNRAMMINGAAKLLGEKPPFPRIPAMDLTPYMEREGASNMPGQGAAGREPTVEAYIEGKPEIGVGRSYGPAGGRDKPIVIDIDGNPL